MRLAIDPASSPLPSHPLCNLEVTGGSVPGSPAAVPLPARGGDARGLTRAKEGARESPPRRCSAADRPGAPAYAFVVRAAERSNYLSTRVCECSLR